MARVRAKKTGALGSSSTFNVSALNEIIVGFETGDMDSDYITNYDVFVNGEWKDMKQAFKDHDLITDNYNTGFFEPRTEEDRVRGYA